MGGKGTDEVGRNAGLLLLMPRDGVLTGLLEVMGKGLGGGEFTEEGEVAEEGEVTEGGQGGGEGDFVFRDTRFHIFLNDFFRDFLEEEEGGEDDFDDFDIFDCFLPPSTCCCSICSIFFLSSPLLLPS